MPRSVIDTRDGRPYPVELGNLHAGGSPCTDFSNAGLLQRLFGPTVGLLATWLLRLHIWSPDLCAHDNVIGFPLWVLMHCLKEQYTAVPVVIEPWFFGTPVRRKRRYTPLIRKRRQLARPLAELIQVFGGCCPIARGRAFARDAASADPQLTPCQKQSLQTYQRLKPDAFLVDLGQHPARRPGVNNEGGLLPTATTGMRYWFWVTLGRFLSREEMLAVQGHPDCPADSHRLMIKHRGPVRSQHQFRCTSPRECHGGIMYGICVAMVPCLLRTHAH